MKGSFLLIFFVLATISSGELGTAQGFDSRLEGLVHKFAAIEGHSDIENLERFFSEDMVFWPEKGPPICGRKAVVELYGIFFQKFDYKPVYKILETKAFGENLVVKGTCQSSRFQFGDLLKQGLEKPFMFFGQENNINTVFSKRSTSPCFVVSARGFEHSTFSDLPIFNSIWKTSQLDPDGLDQLNIQKTISLAFFKKYLFNHNAIQIENLAESYANISIEVYHE